MEKTGRARDGQLAKRDPEADFRAGQGAVEQQQRANRPQDRKKLHLPGVTPGAFALTLAERDTQHTAKQRGDAPVEQRSEEHTSELQSLMRISYAVFCSKKINNQ